MTARTTPYPAATSATETRLRLAASIVLTAITSAVLAIALALAVFGAMEGAGLPVEIPAPPNQPSVPDPGLGL